LGKSVWELGLETSLGNVTFWECLEENKCGEIFVEIVSNFLLLNGEILFLKIGVGDVVPTKLDDSKMCKEKISK
jgi:hypothetical protein